MNPITLFLTAAFALAGVAAGQWVNIYLAPVFFVLAAVVALSVKVANVWQKFVILRVGKLQSVKGAGFFMIIPVLAIAGSLAKKKIVPESAGTFPVTGGLFAGLLVSTILIVWITIDDIHSQMFFLAHSLTFTFLVLNPSSFGSYRTSTPKASSYLHVCLPAHLSFL